MHDKRTAARERPYVTTKQASHYLGVSARLIEDMRRKGTGPRFRRHGRIVVYHIDDLDAWSLSRIGDGTSHA
jgi:predicted DNA-binding transcriptional regulator AlpA